MASRATAPSVDDALASNTVIGPGGQTRTVSERVARRVWIAAGGRCTICNRYLLDDETTGQDVMIGQLAHIVGWSTADGSPRGADDLAVELRGEADNLLLLCYDQHKVIDDKSLWAVYDADTLRALKREHESRVRDLTAMGHDKSTTVLRVVGNIHDQAVDLTDARIREALFTRNRFPDWTLRGADEYEVDLRTLPGERDGTPIYWASARAHLDERLGRLRTLVAKGRITHLSVFPLARIPVLILLGTLLDDTVPVDLYPKRRGGDEAWGWTPAGGDVEFRITRVRVGSDRTKVALLVSVSGSVDHTLLPDEIDDSYTIYELRPADTLPVPGLIGSAKCLDAFSRTWREALATVEAHHPGVQAIPTFSAVPAAAAVSMGRHLMRAAHPPLHIYDRVTGASTYQFTASTAETGH
ncbi:SAVED domain-containing protein [Mycobacterium sp. ITM-2016-00317]|uniref:SAVED domain-containing protein n=1 Tax=Mycobacterium sp. ITM-2016-00317 TaxID=2099694 RepID=UPI00287FC85E|nr:SAVED domain-containing protein [Mycobacterium sp. ITM-2016-00317]WNG87753.1 SAVED domain-containing protein [Mycobacterium sp. ITM-2016-00317]